MAKKKTAKKATKKKAAKKKPVKKKTAPSTLSAKLEKTIEKDFQACEELLRTGEGREFWSEENCKRMKSWQEAAEAGGFSGGSDKDNVKNLARLNLFHSFTTMIWSQSTRSSFLPLKFLGNLRDTQVSHFCVVSVKS